MDVISQLIARVEDYRATNKNPCKNYGTQAAAQAATGKAAQQAANHFAKDRTKDADPLPLRGVLCARMGSLGGRAGLHRTPRSPFFHRRIPWMHARMVYVLDAHTVTGRSR